MDRKDFLKNSALISIGGMLLPSFFLSGCKKDSLFEEVNYDGKVIIIGAGAAGLYAGYILKSKGIDFQILEASSQHGGRLGKLTGFSDYPLDTGAQWLHGQNSILGDLIKKSNTPISLDDSAEFWWFNNEIVETLPQDIDIFEVEGLPDISFWDYAQQQGFGEEYHNIVEAVAGDQGAAGRTLSAFYNNFDELNWSSGDFDYKFEGTYFDLIDSQIASQITDKISLNTVITDIDYSSNSIVITDSNLNTYTADKVIIAIPITMLKNNSINFTPALPAEKTEAFSKIGMDPGMKVFMKFSDKFYNENLAGGAVCAAYSDESVGKTGSDNVLLAFVMGDQAAALHALGSDTAIVNALLAELDTMYNGQASATYISSNVQNWTAHPYIQGAYSYGAIGQGEDSRRIAAQSVDNKLFFAGEAMNLNGHHQTVHGAVETGYREVINILEGVQE
jgi:monoamine oxidase